MDREQVLKKAAELVSNDRQRTYGDALESHSRIADFWSAYLGVKLDAVDAAAMMVLLKISRTVGTRRAGVKHDDSWIDICGYSSIASELESRLSKPQRRGRKSDRGEHGKE